MKKQKVAFLAYLAVVALVALVAVQPPVADAGPAQEETMLAPQEVADPLQSTISSVAAYEGLPLETAAARSPFYRLFVPRATASSLLSTLFIQNPGATIADVMVQFYAADGAIVAPYTFSIPPHGSHTLVADALPDGFEGGAVIESTALLQAVVNLQDTTSGSLLSYTAVPAGSTATSLPRVMRNYYGWNTSMSIQNTSPSDATVNISYLSNSGAVVYNTIDTIPALVSRVYRQADVPELGTSFAGTAIVTADQPLAVVVERWSMTTAAASAYNGVPDNGAAYTFFPRQQEAMEGWTSFTEIMNAGMVPATLLASWYSVSGSEEWTDYTTVPSGASYTYALDTLPLPSPFDGSLRLIADQPLAALAHSQNQEATGDGLATTTGLGLDQSATMVSLPRVAHGGASELSTEISIQNVSGIAGSATVVFYDGNGTATATVSVDLPADGAVRYNTAAVSELGSDWQGSAIVLSDQPIAVEAMQVLGSAAAETYIHVGDLDGAASLNKGKWTASVTIMVHDALCQPVENVTVSGQWSDGTMDTCVTDDSGLCEVSQDSTKKTKSLDWTVQDLVGSGYIYDYADNHDSDGDSDGTTITVSRKSSPK